MLEPERVQALMTAGTACRATTLLVGVACPLHRGWLLNRGFGDAIGRDAVLDEVAARAERLLRHGSCEPRCRRHRDLTVDLFARDAFSGERRIGLHPREFALLWRLMATPGEVVGKAQLLREVWRLRHEPETNSLAVHVHRLRVKLAAAGFPGLIETRAPGYSYVAPDDHGPALPLPDGEPRLDAYLGLTDDPSVSARV